MTWSLAILLVISLGILAYSVFLAARMSKIVKHDLQRRLNGKEVFAKEAIPSREDTDQFTEKIIDAIRRHISDNGLNIDILAEEMNVSVSQLTRKTKSILGESPYKLITRIRMEHAVKLMAEKSMNITEIAHSCGYPELSNFSRAFSKYWQMSPTAMMKDISTEGVTSGCDKTE